MAPEPMERPEHTEEHFLGEVERLVAVAQQVDRELHDHPLMLRDELGAGGFFALGAAIDERRFAAADVRPSDDSRLLHGEFHYTSLDPETASKFRPGCYDKVLVRKTIAGLAAGLLIVVAAAALAYQIAARQRDYRALVVRGDTALRDDQSFAAIEAYSGAIALRPDSMLGYLRRGQTYRRRADRGDLESAARDFRKAASLDPSASRPLEELGDVRYQLQQYERAIEAYDAAARLDDRSPGLLYKTALARYRHGDLDGAMGALTQTLRLDDRLPDAHYLLGLCLRDKRRTAEAVKAFEKAVALSPALVAAREELADLYGGLDRKTDEIDQLTLLAGLDPSHVQRRVAVALAHARARRWDAAVMTLSGALERAPDDPALYQAIGQVWLESAQARGDRVDLSKARVALARVASSPGATSDVLLLAGRAALLDEDPDAAEQALLQATQRFPLAPRALLLYATVAERQKHPDAARTALVRYTALEADGADFAAHATKIATLSLRMGDQAAAAEWVQRGLAREPQNATLLALARQISDASDRSRPAARPPGN